MSRGGCSRPESQDQQAQFRSRTPSSTRPAAAARYADLVLPVAQSAPRRACSVPIVITTYTSFQKPPRLLYVIYREQGLMFANSALDVP
eukprot:gene25302-biopygen10533